MCCDSVCSVAEVWCCSEHYCGFLMAGSWLEAQTAVGLFLMLLKLHKLAVRKHDLSWGGGLTRCHRVLDHGLNLHQNIPLISSSQAHWWCTSRLDCRASSLLYSLFSIYLFIHQIVKLMFCLPQFITNRPNKIKLTVTSRKLEDFSGLNTVRNIQDNARTQLTTTCQIPPKMNLWHNQPNFSPTSESTDRRDSAELNPSHCRISASSRLLWWRLRSDSAGQLRTELLAVFFCVWILWLRVSQTSWEAAEVASSWQISQQSLLHWCLGGPDAAETLAGSLTNFDVRNLNWNFMLNLQDYSPNSWIIMINLTDDF